MRTSCSLCHLPHVLKLPGTDLHIAPGVQKP